MRIRTHLVLIVAVAAAACGQGQSRTDAGAGAVAAGTEPPAPVEVRATPTVGDQLRELYADFGSDIYTFEAEVDLNGDGADEIIVHVVGPMICGTGGCDTLVFTQRTSGHEIVGEIAVTRPPIRVSTASTNGWRNLIVHISGGGIQPGFDGEVPFDGAAYQSNPTAPMVAPAADLDAAQIVIPEFETLTDGTPLFTE